MGVKGLTVTNKNQDFPSSYNNTTLLVSWWRQGKKNNDPWTGEVELRDNRSTSRGGVGYRVKNLSPPQWLKKKSCWIFIDLCLPSFCVADISLQASVERRGYWKWYFFNKKCPKSFQKWDKYPISPSLKLKHHTNSYLQVALLFLRLSLEPLFSPVSFFLLLLFLLVSLHIFCDLGVVDSSCLAECFGDTSLSLSTQLNFIQKWENKAVTRQ